MQEPLKIASIEAALPEGEHGVDASWLSGNRGQIAARAAAHYSFAMDSRASFDKIAADLIGVNVSHIWRGHGTAIFFELGRLTPSTVRRRDGSMGAPNGEFCISLEWSWRIEQSNHIICGSWSDEEIWKPALQQVLGSVVTKLSLFGRLPEIQLALSHDRYVTSFMTAEGQPGWRLADRRTNPSIWIGVRDGALDKEHSADPRP